MPNHVHLLFQLPKRDKSRSTYPVTNILRLIKGSTARSANKILGRSGSFWQHESYDHLVRNDDERERIIRYILKNPVKAGLTEKWEDWKWMYCKEKYFPIR
jgi:REP element-mobilizing transposase RayT